MKKIVLFISVVAIILFSFNALVVNSYAIVLRPTADGHLFYAYYPDTPVPDFLRIKNYIKVSSVEYCDDFNRPGKTVCWYEMEFGIMEFNISTLGRRYTGDQVQASLFLTVKEGDLYEDKCLSFYNIQDENENGVVEVTDSETTDYIGEVCGPFQREETIIFDVSSALDHDLFDTDQTGFSGFILKPTKTLNIEFYDHTDPENSPRLSVIDTDVDRDGVLIGEDNCPFDYNPNQEDTFPPEGNGIGDACECEGDLDCDRDQDGLDAAKFKEEFGSSSLSGHCSEANSCKGDFDLDGAVDGMDAYTFKEDFGRCPFNNPCPNCVVEE